MITEEELDRYRQEGIRVRVERDAEPANDVRGLVVAWDSETVLLRKLNRKLLKLPREYRYKPDSEPRT
ncbi:hypothetical protein [Gorillibacterium sp. sgz5001074]|uniref:hypothetical protein n=1 Tax=Gorillibacterium sp. sgz5001074 TaxID=3446695 RepID=UPI003F67FADF